MTNNDATVNLDTKPGDPVYLHNAETKESFELTPGVRLREKDGVLYLQQLCFKTEEGKRLEAVWMDVSIFRDEEDDFTGGNDAA